MVNGKGTIRNMLVKVALVTSILFMGNQYHLPVVTEVQAIVEFPQIEQELYLDKGIDWEKALQERDARLGAEAVEAASREGNAETSQNEFDALVNATYILETGHGKSRLWREQFNAGGIKCGSRFCSYGSEEEGLTALRTLLQKYVDRHGYNLKAIRDIYSETDDTALFRSIYNKELSKLNREG